VEKIVEVADMNWSWFWVWWIFMPLYIVFISVKIVDFFEVFK